MPSTTPSACTTTTRIAKVPYLNSAPYFRGLKLEDGLALIEYVPRELGERAAAGELVAGLLPLVDYFRLEERFERIGPFGIAVRGRSHSALLFSRKPIRQLDGAEIVLTQESATTVRLLRLLLEQRYHLVPAAYRPERDLDPDALLVIGDEALRMRHTNTTYPFETDVSFEWWLWQHLPFVFAVWAIRRDARPEVKRAVEVALMRSLGRNATRLEGIAAAHAETFRLPAEILHGYLANFIYRLSAPEAAGIQRFRELLNAHHLL